MKGQHFMRFLFAVLFILMTTILFSLLAKADLVRVWRPGLVTYVEAGQEIHYVVEAEDAKAFKSQKTIPLNLAPFPKTDLQKAMDDIPNSTYCGEYKEVTDDDL